MTLEFSDIAFLRFSTPLSFLIQNPRLPKSKLSPVLRGRFLVSDTVGSVTFIHWSVFWHLLPTSKFPDSGLLLHYMRAVSSRVPNSSLTTECPALIHIQRVNYTITGNSLSLAKVMRGVDDFSIKGRQFLWTPHFSPLALRTYYDVCICCSFCFAQCLRGLRKSIQCPSEVMPCNCLVES